MIMRRIVHSKHFFCSNKGWFSRIQASQLDDHIKKWDYQTVICSTWDFEILRKEEGKHDCVSRMLEHIKKCTEKNEELSEELKELQIRESEVKNKLDEMTTENNNITMRLTQKSEQYERENAMILHDISSVSTKSPQRTRQDEIDELNEFDNVTQYTVNNYAKKVENKITSHANEVNSEFERMQERLREHFKRFANRVRDRFEREVIHAGINQEFDKLSPIKKANTFDDERLETGESNHLSGVNESEEQELNDEWLTAEMRETKNKLVKAYTSPLREYQTAIDTTAEFRKITKLEKDLEYMDPIQKLRKSERSTSLDQQRRREEMKKRLESSKMGQTMGNRGNNQDLAKSARLLNAFDTHDPYPENKFTINFVVPSVPQTVSVTPKEKSSSLSRIKSENVYGQNKVRRKKDELVKALLLNNRNR